MVSVCLPSDALSKHLPSDLGFSYLGRGVSLHSCSSKAQPLLLTLDEGYLLTAAPPDLECGVVPLHPPVPAQPPLLGLRLSFHEILIIFFLVDILTFFFSFPYFYHSNIMNIPNYTERSRSGKYTEKGKRIRSMWTGLDFQVLCLCMAMGQLPSLSKS